MTATITNPTAYDADVAALTAAGIPATFEYFGHGWQIIVVELGDDRRLLIGSVGANQCLPVRRGDLSGWQIDHLDGVGDLINRWNTNTADTDSLVALCRRVYADHTN
ncbi:hypothetical protein [Gordonia sihwensis]|uniref:hypothetical protein n=1 Tax=Gordonia sihwensis TaxID=173559 RepID=UPI0005ED7400|nr:hypothetical protein [Gordonia sihwensis]KJR10531.1 hypothetical protein UG54_00610 [Gordonia sihwensis]